jgi:CubicO group peptidase (beta-lactamase class C family)
MKRLFMAVLFVVCLFSIFPRAQTLVGGIRGQIAQNPVDGDLTARLEQFLLGEADSGFNGVVLVTKSGRTILHKAYGFRDGARTVRVRTDTPFWIASISKQFTAAAILKLVEQGRLSLDDSLNRFFPDAPPDKRAITIHQLLSHTAGIDGRDAADGIVERRAAVSAIFSSPLAREPGTDFGYTNDAYHLLATIIEAVAQQPYEAYVRDTLLMPARLPQTGFSGPAEQPQVAAILRPITDAKILRPNWGYRGATGMYSSANDLYRWYLALSEGRVVSRTSVQLLFTPHGKAGTTGAGYGWFVSETPRKTKLLWTRGYEGFGHGAVLAIYPDESVVIVVLSNSDKFSPNVPMNHSLAAMVADLVFGHP